MVTHGRLTVKFGSKWDPEGLIFTEHVLRTVSWNCPRVVKSGSRSLMRHARLCQTHPDVQEDGPVISCSSFNFIVVLLMTCGIIFLALVERSDERHMQHLKRQLSTDTHTHRDTMYMYYLLTLRWHQTSPRFRTAPKK